jgi:serine/threonine protein kinase
MWQKWTVKIVSWIHEMSTVLRNPRPIAWPAERARPTATEYIAAWWQLDGHSTRPTSVRELLEALRDAIAGHKSLLEDGKILHRDVSENNIVITESTTCGAPKGRLIDLDLAKELDSAPSGASHRTDTMQFMAIEVLQGEGHTYRHDLEPFFYVFVWMCIRYGYEDVDLEGTAAPSSSKPDKTRIRPMKTSRLRGWYSGTYTEIARNKLGDMVGFEDVTAEFALSFIVLKGLAEELRNVLFRGRDLAPFTGTYKDRSIMYAGMINAFNKAISHLGKE